MCNEIEQRPGHDHSCLLRQYETSQTNSNCKNTIHEFVELMTSTNAI